MKRFLLELVLVPYPDVTPDLVLTAEKDILYCVVTRLEIGRVKAIVREVDPSAFVVFHPVAGAEGGMVTRTILH